MVTELVGAPSSGRTTLAYAAMVAVTAAGGLAACIDLPDAFDPEHAGAAGIVLARVLWVRPRDPYGAFRAAEQVVGAGGFSLVLVDLDVMCSSSTKVSAGTWYRLARAAEQSRSAVMILNGRRSEGAFPTVCLETERRRAGFDGDGPSELFDGIISVVHLRKYKLGSPVAAPLSLHAAATA